MSVKGKRHIHKYYKARVLGEKLWACAIPTCSHHMPPHYNSLMPGKATICWKCDEAMILDPDALNMDKPMCMECRGLSSESLDEFLKEKGVTNKFE